MCSALPTSTRSRAGSPQLSDPGLFDLVITLAVNWSIEGALDAVGTVAWAFFGVWALCYLDCSGNAGLASDTDGGRGD